MLWVKLSVVDKSEEVSFKMFVKGIRRNYDKINADESIADEDKIDALLKVLGKDYLISSEDRVYVFQKDDLSL